MQFSLAPGHQAAALRIPANSDPAVHPLFAHNPVGASTTARDVACGVLLACLTRITTTMFPSSHTRAKSKYQSKSNLGDSNCWPRGNVPNPLHYAASTRIGKSLEPGYR